ncbi:hypothetical protein AnigIFM63604_004093 [Aspergillus niger]|uniref:Apple domain-containing protein n=1 Tax=Aspergillus niger TaxID=5061 RepID=A0A9W6EGE7_ASPNG|nr:hypothetical protein AnigIFM63604_004093 [Aspergillus niger]
MKFSPALLFHLAVLSAAQASATCVPGTRETISPGYEVEYQCDVYRTGEMKVGIASTKDCAALCKDNDLTVCTYYPKTKKCMLGAVDGVDKPKAGAYYLKKVDDGWEDDEWEDPEDCEAEKADLSLSLKECEKTKAAAVASADSRAVCPNGRDHEVIYGGSHYKVWCNRNHDARSPKEIHPVSNLGNCIALCNARAWCTYALQSATEAKCQLHDLKVNAATTPGVVNSGAWTMGLKL